MPTKISFLLVACAISGDLCELLLMGAFPQYLAPKLTTSVARKSGFLEHTVISRFVYKIKNSPFWVLLDDAIGHRAGASTVGSAAKVVSMFEKAPESSRWLARRHTFGSLGLGSTVGNFNRPNKDGSRFCRDMQKPDVMDAYV